MVFRQLDLINNKIAILYGYDKTVKGIHQKKVIFPVVE
jgi:hypothetical protein